VGAVGGRGGEGAIKDCVQAKVILDSASQDGVRLSALALKYPRVIHAEFMTHCVFSRNSHLR